MIKLQDNKAQAAVELAVFGAVLIYIIGSIVRTAVSNSYTQDYNFQAFRLALLTSWQTSTPNPYNPNISHNNATVLFVQDRLSPDPGKYGDVDRNPYIAQGSGTFSYELDYPLDSASAVKDNAPIMDVFINGVHFAFTTASYGSYDLKKTSCGSGGPYSPPQTQAQCLQNQCLRNNREWKGGYKLFYTMDPNGSPANGIPTFPPTCNSDLTKDTDGGICDDKDVFDLGRNGQDIVPSSLRKSISWAWAATPAASTSSIGLNTDSNEFPSYDVDGRLKEVTIFGFNGSSVQFEDFQGGDIDATWDLTSCKPKPGLLNSSEIYTFTSNAGASGPSQGPTYLQIKEGNLYNPGNGHYVRSMDSHDNVDVVQREIQLSNNNGEWCKIGGKANGIPNPVEACSNNCFSADTITKTCLDTNTNIIFVRSRLQNVTGHAWLTDIAGQMKVQQ